MEVVAVAGFSSPAAGLAVGPGSVARAGGCDSGNGSSAATGSGRSRAGSHVLLLVLSLHGHLGA